MTIWCSFSRVLWQNWELRVKTNPIDLMAFMQQVFMEDNYEMTAYMSYWFPYDPYTFVANMYPSTDYTDPSGIYSTDPQVAKALANMSDTESKELIGGLYNTMSLQSFKRFIQRLWTVPMRAVW